MSTNGVPPQLSRWADRLRDLTVSPLTRDYPEPSQEDKKKRSIEAVESLGASQDSKNALKQLRHLGSPFHLLLTAYAILVSRFTGDEDIAIATNAEVDGKPFILRLPITAKETFSQLAAKVQSVSVNMQSSRATSFLTHCRIPQTVQQISFLWQKLVHTSRLRTCFASQPSIHLCLLLM